MATLGTHLLDCTSLTAEHLSAAEALQDQRGGRLGAILLDEGWPPLFNTLFCNGLCISLVSGVAICTIPNPSNNNKTAYLCHGFFWI